MQFTNIFYIENSEVWNALKKRTSFKLLKLKVYNYITQSKAQKTQLIQTEDNKSMN